MSGDKWVTHSGPSGTFEAWRVGEGARLMPGSPLLLASFHSAKKTLKADKVGTVVKLGELKTGDELGPTTRLYLFRDCEHPVVMKDMCGDCGADLREKDGRPGQRVLTATATVPMIHSLPELHVSEEEGRADNEHLIAQRKLELLVDLDQTLIHTTNDQPPPGALKDLHSFRLPPHSPLYYTKLRPGAQPFLAAIADTYRLHIATFGARLYAHKIAEILDPTGKLFGTRILSRDETFDPNLKSLNLKSLFPCGDHLVCIIDDREDVWGNAANVVLVEPYRFFQHTGDINAPPGFTKAGRNEEKKELEDLPPDTDDYLIQLELILRRIHSAFYQLYDARGPGDELPHLKTVMAYVKKKVLAGVHIVFSGLFPNTARAEDSWAWQLALDMGATVHDDVQSLGASRTTHVIAAKYGTSKVLAAVKATKANPDKPVHIVQAQWLWKCNQRWERLPESWLAEVEGWEGGCVIGEVYTLEEGGVTKPPPLERPRAPPASHSQPKVGTGMESAPLSPSELSEMASEIDDALSGEDDDEVEDDEDSEAESLSGEMPKGWKRKAPEGDDDDAPTLPHKSPRVDEEEAGEEGEEGSEGGSESIGSVDDDMADALDDLLSKS